MHVIPLILTYNLLPSLCPASNLSFSIFATPSTYGTCSTLLVLLPRLLTRLLLLNCLEFYKGTQEVFVPEMLNLLHLVLRFSVNLNCIQQFSLNYSSSFRIPEYSTLRSGCIHSESGSLSPNDSHTNGRVAIFFRQSLSFSDHSTSSFSLSRSLFTRPLLQLRGDQQFVEKLLFFFFVKHPRSSNFFLSRQIAELTTFLQKYLHSVEIQLPLSFLGLKRNFSHS